MKMLFFEEVTSREGVKPNPKKLHAAMEITLNNRNSITITFRYNKIPRKIFAFNNRGI